MTRVNTSWHMSRAVLLATTKVSSALRVLACLLVWVRARVFMRERADQRSTRCRGGETIAKARKIGKVRRGKRGMHLCDRKSEFREKQRERACVCTCVCMSA